MPIPKMNTSGMAEGPENRNAPNCGAVVDTTMDTLSIRCFTYEIHAGCRQQEIVVQTRVVRDAVETRRATSRHSTEKVHTRRQYTYRSDGNQQTGVPLRVLRPCACNPPPPPSQQLHKFHFVSALTSFVSLTCRPPLLEFPDVPLLMAIVLTLLRALFQLR